MPRPPRIEFPGALYHVSTRGNARRDIFHSEADRERFLEQLRHCLEQHEVRLFSYVLMGNHYHLFLQTRHSNLSAFCQRLNTSYALYARFRHHAPGHIFQGRFHAKVVEDESYLPVLTRYIHLNPARTRAARALRPAERVRLLEQYRWSSFRGYSALSEPEDFVCYDALRDFGANRAQAGRAYRAFVLEHISKDDAQTQELLGASSCAIGGRAFVQKIEEELNQRRTGGAVDMDVAWPRRSGAQIAIEEVDRAVCAALGVTREALFERGRRGGGARLVAVEVAARVTGLPLRGIGRHYHLTPGAVTERRKRLAQNPDKEIHALVRQLVSSVSGAGPAPGNCESPCST
jgi:REP element-mobilizing transposase RayT